MGSRIPAAIGWLIKRRARLSGIIARIEVELLRIDALENRLSRYQEDLKAIDRTLTLYEIPIDGTTIPPVRPSKEYDVRQLRQFFKHGEITRKLFQELRNANEGLTTSEITTRLMDSTDIGKGTISIDAETYLRLKDLVRKRLGCLCAEGKVERLHEVITTEEGRWKLPSRQG